MTEEKKPLIIKRKSTNADRSNSTDAASPVIKDIALDILKDNKDRRVPLQFIKNQVEKHTGVMFSAGSFSGAMRDLVEESKGRVVNIERGYYIYMGNAKTYEINAAIEKLITDLNEIAVVNVLTTGDADIEAIKKIPSIQRQLKQLKIDQEQ